MALRRGGYGVVFPESRRPRQPRDWGAPSTRLRHAIEAAGEWAQAVAVPRRRLLEALRDDSCVKAALADGAVLAVVPLIFSSGKGAKANILLDVGANPKWTPWHSRRWPFLCSTFANKAETEAMRRATFAKGGKGGPNKMFRQQAAGPDRPGETGKDQTAAPGSKRAIGGPRGVDVHGK